MRRLVVIALLPCAAACTRDLSVPGETGPGTISGHAVYSVPGQADRQPATNAIVTVLGTSLTTTTSATGNFVLEGVRSTGGTLLIRFDADQNGSYERQRLLQLSDYGVGPGRQISLGDVIVAQNARMHGKALRGDRLDQAGGHAGSTVFVPAGPFTTYTADDGTFAFSELPEGKLSFSIFRPGYAPREIDEIDLRAGEDFPLADIVLALADGPQPPGSVSGKVSLDDGSPASGAAISGSTVGGGAFNGSTKSDGTYQLDAVPAGVYDVAFSLSGFSTVVVYNVFVAPGTNAALAEVTLGHGETFDAGVRPTPPDAGAVDAGVDAGTDAGTDAGMGTDGGCVGGCTHCTWNGDCPPSQWCDVGICRPPCASSAQCSGNRVCDAMTQTCVTPCGGGCGGGLVCELSTMTCRTPCSMSAPCGQGQRCSAGLCVAQCANNGDCAALGIPFSQCQMGACVPNGNCADDTTCDAGTWCVSGVCRARTGLIDAGFACAGPCDCRLAERCESGLCVAEPAPTLYLRPDAGPGPAAVIAGLDAGSEPVVIAMLGGETFDLGATTLNITRSNTTLAGGYTQCETYRWVRGSGQRTALQNLYGLYVNGSLASPVTGVALRDLAVTPPTTQTCIAANVIDGTYTRNLELTNVSATQTRVGCTGRDVATLHCANCDDLVLTDVLIDQPATDTTYKERGIWLQLGNATLVRPYVKAPYDYYFYGIEIDAPQAAVVVDQARIENLQFIREGYGIWAQEDCQGPVTVSNSTITWPRFSGPMAVTKSYAVHAINCPSFTATDNVVDGRAVNGTVGTTTYAFEVENSGGSIARNLVYFPIGGANESVFGIELDGPLAAFTVESNRIVPGAAGLIRPLGVVGVSNGPLTMRSNTIRGGAASDGTGITLSAVSGLAGLTITDNDVVAAGQCGGVQSIGFYATGSAAVLERNRFATVGSHKMQAASIEVGSSLELYENFFTNGVGCQGANDYAVALQLGSQGYVPGIYAVGNTFEALGNTGFASTAIDCNQATGVFIGNVFGAGVGNTHRFAQIPGHPNCLGQSQWLGNYFWYDLPGAPPTPGDYLVEVTTEDAGTFDPNGNIVMNDVGCIDPLGPRPSFVITPTSRCVDRGGDAGVRRNGTAIARDIDGGVRVRGGGVDIGCFEAQ